MPLPAGLNLVTITGGVRRSDGTPAIGQVEFALPAPLLDSHDQLILGTAPIVGPLVNGQVNMQVPANDTAGVSPAGWAYAVTIRTDGLFVTFQAVVPSSPASITIDQLVQVASPPVPAVYVGLQAIGAPNGVASLDGTGHIPLGQLPAGSGVLSVSQGDSTITIGGNAANPTVRVASTVTASITSAASAAAAAQTTASAAYVKPGSGIPSTDLATAVQTVLTAAGTAYQKPGPGIPQADLTAAVQALLALAGTALQIAPADPAAMAYDCHACNFDPELAPQNSTINEQWFMRVLVRAGRQINLVKTLVRTAGTAGAGGLNGFSLYDDAFSTLLWNSVSDDTVWLTTGEVSKAVTGSLAGLTNRTPTVDTWFRVGISARGHTAPPNFPFASGSGSNAVSDAGHYRTRYRASAYSAWPASLVPATDLSGVAGFAPPVLIG